MNKDLLHLIVLVVMLLIIQYHQATSVAILDDLDNVATITADNFDTELATNHLVVLFYDSGYKLIIQQLIT